MIACQKGYDEKKYLWWTFFFGIAGMLMVVALPPQTVKAEASIALPVSVTVENKEPIPVKAETLRAAAPSDELPDL